jgi:hypothetical protein
VEVYVGSGDKSADSWDMWAAWVGKAVGGRNSGMKDLVILTDRNVNPQVVIQPAGKSDS